MNIAILGATSLIARSLIKNFIKNNPEINISLFVRDLSSISLWIKKNKITTKIKKTCLYKDFSNQDDYDVLFNFVGIGDPSKVIKIGSSIIDITYQYDSLAIDYINCNPETKYIFLSSGAVYGSKNFSTNINNGSKSKIDINNIDSHDYYSVAKLLAETRHRSLQDKSIIDVRIYNYISSDIDINSSFLIADLIRAIINKNVLKTSSQNIFRDYIGPDDFYRLIISLIKCKNCNDFVDCYTKSPIDKLTLLKILKEEFELDYHVIASEDQTGVTDYKKNYYSKNYKASQYGYIPKLSSIETIREQLKIILSQNS